MILEEGSKERALSRSHFGVAVSLCSRIIFAPGVSDNESESERERERGDGNVRPCRARVRCTSLQLVSRGAGEFLLARVSIGNADFR